MFQVRLLEPEEPSDGRAKHIDEHCTRVRTKKAAKMSSADRFRLSFFVPRIVYPIIPLSEKAGRGNEGLEPFPVSEWLRCGYTHQSKRASVAKSHASWLSVVYQPRGPWVWTESSPLLPSEPRFHCVSRRLDMAILDRPEYDSHLLGHTLR